MPKEQKIKKVNLVNIKTAKPKEEGSKGAQAGAKAVAVVKDVPFASSINSVRNGFLRGIAFIYFVAFLSIYLQIEGLYGTNGVTPVKAELSLQKRSADACFRDKLTLLCFVPQYLGINSQLGLELFALSGVAIASLGVMCVHMCVAPVLAVLWILYFSIYSVGNVFMWFQWDILLLEAGILAVLAAPWFPTKGSFESKPRDLVTVWMVKWLLFRLMFASGVVKLSSGCPTWWGLTALNYHFESQCLPTPLAYYAHQLPAWILKLGVVGTYYIEILLPFAFFAPFSNLRLFSFWLQVIFQLSIILTGNYNFFNLLTILLCVSLLDGDFLKKRGSGEKKPEGISFSRIFVRTFSYTLIGLSMYYTGKFFSVSYEGGKVLSKINFKNIEFNWFISLAVPYSMALGFLTLVSTILHSIVISLLDVKGGFNKVKSLFSVLSYGLVCLALFSITLVPYSSLHKETNQALPEQLRDAYAKTSRYHLTSSYGLFRRMTGTDGGRPEVILEHANDLKGPWEEYQFLYKPGNLSAPPTFLIPHQPRLDWQMWFAALSTYHDTPWLVSLSYRLLQGEPSVRNLLDKDKLPTPAPKYIKGSLYRYKFTSLYQKPQDWWKRKLEKDFLPTYSVEHPPLVDFMKKLGYLEPDVEVKGSTGELIQRVLDYIRNFVLPYRPEYLMWASITALVAITVTSKML